MAILSVAEKKGVRTAQLNKLWQRTYVRVFQVVTTTPHDAGVAVLNAVGPDSVAIPFLGSSYTNGYAGFTQTEYDFGSFAETIEAREITEDGLQWEVTVSYGPYDAGQFGKDPTQWKPKIQFGGQKFERVVTVDQDGNTILNSAGDPFAEPVTIDDTRASFTVVRNELVNTFDFILAQDMSDSINNGVWNGFDQYTVKLGAITTSESQYDSVAQVWYFAVTYPFEVDRDQWGRSLLDQGYQQLDSSTPPKSLAIRTDQGQPITEAALLDGTGKKLAHGADPVYLDFPVYKERDFSTLNIDLSHVLGRT